MSVSFGVKLLLLCLGFSLLLVICRSQVCIPTWTPYPRSYSRGGSPKSSVRLLQDCLARCERLDDCVAIDFDLSSTVYCWLHNDISDLTGDYFREDNKDNVTQYRINRNCTNYGKGPECPEQWNQTTGIVSYRGEQVNYWTEYDCFTYCLHSNTCSAVYFHDKTNPPCWVQKERQPKKVDTSDGVVQYQLNKTCPSSASRSHFQIGRCVGQYFPKTSWCPPGTKIYIEDAWFKVNPLCCYRNAEDAYPPDSSSLRSLEVSYLDPNFFSEINSSCGGRSDCTHSLRAKSNRALGSALHCLDGEIGTNYVAITYQCRTDDVMVREEMTRRNTPVRKRTTTKSTTKRTTGRMTMKTKNNPDVDMAAGDYMKPRGSSDHLIIGLVIGLGVPLILTAIIVTVVILVRRRKRKDIDQLKESYRADNNAYISETMPRGAIPDNEVNEISANSDTLW